MTNSSGLIFYYLIPYYSPLNHEWLESTTTFNGAAIKPFILTIIPFISLFLFIQK